MKNKRNIKLEEKGVTLIALVVTMIVLLILAGISISISLNDKGIIIRTKEAAEGYRQAEEEEDNEIIEFKEQVKEKTKGEMIVNVIKSYVLMDNGNLYMIGNKFIHTDGENFDANQDNLDLTLIDTNVADIYNFGSGSYDILYITKDKKCYVRGQTYAYVPSTLVTDSLKSLYIRDYRGFVYIDNSNTLYYYSRTGKGNIKIADNVKKYGAWNRYINNSNEVYSFQVTNELSGTVVTTKATENVDQLRQQIEEDPMTYDENHQYSNNREKDSYSTNAYLPYVLNFFKNNDKWYYNTTFDTEWHPPVY